MVVDLGMTSLSDSKASLPVWALASGLGGVCEGAASNALRFVKVEMQLGTGSSGWDAVKRLGVGAKSGLLAHCAVTGAANSMAYTGHAALHGPLLALSLPDDVASGAAGGLAGVIEAVATTPARRAMVLAQAHPSRYPSVRAAFLGIARAEGTRGLLRGASAAALRDASGCAIFFPVAWRVRELAPQNAMGNVAAAVVAAAAANFVSQPIDTVVSVMQASGNQSTLGTCRSLLAQGGLARLYRGAGFNVLRAIPGPAAGFAVTVPVMQALCAADTSSTPG